MESALDAAAAQPPESDVVFRLALGQFRPQPIQFPGPPGSKHGTIFIGDAIF